MLEVIGQSLDDIKKINDSVAERVELVVGINNGGLTPPIEFSKEAAEISTKPIVVMVRNHWDNFEITDEQLEVVLKQIKELQDTKVQGIVWGAITKDKKINEVALDKVMKAAGKLDVVFHKAFDRTDNRVEALEVLKKYGVKRVLTAGGLGSPLDNEETLHEMKKVGGVEILIGGGVTEESIPKIKKLGFKDYHVGSRVRCNQSYDSDISLEEIKTFHNLVGA